MKCNFFSVPCLSAFGSLFECCSFEMAEQYCFKDSDKSQENQNEYLRIIDDLSTDLNNLSCQVNMVSSEFLNDGLAEQFESSLKALEAHNDRLQGAIDSLIVEKDNTERTLQTKNEELKEQVCCLENKVTSLQRKIDDLVRKPCERCGDQGQRQRIHRSNLDDKIERLESEFRWKCKAVENLKKENEELQRELTDIRRNRAKTKLLQRRESNQDQNPNQQDLLTQLKAAQAKNLEQSKSLQKASKQITCLQTDIDELHANEDIYKKERDLLHSELTALKESHASQIGIEQSLKDQIHRTTNEVLLTKQKLSECKQEKDQIKNIYRDETKLLRDINFEIITKYNNLVQDYNKKALEYQKLVQIIEEKDKILVVWDDWKMQQIERDNELQRKTQLFEEHIKQMLEDKQKILDRLNETENVNHILKETLENSRRQFSGHPSSIGSIRGNKTSTNNSALGDSVSKVIENVRHTSRKLSQQRSILEDETINFSTK